MRVALARVYMRRGTPRMMMWRHNGKDFSNEYGGVTM